MTATAASAKGRHRYTNLVLPVPPDDHEKASYSGRSLPFLATALAVSAVCIVVAQVWMEIRHPMSWPLPDTPWCTSPTRS